MNNKQKLLKIAFLLFIFFVSAFHHGLKAQTISTYYNFHPEVINPTGLKVDTSGNFYFINYDKNWNASIMKLSSDGIISTFVPGSYNPQSFGLDKAGNLFFSDGSTWPPVIKKITPDGTISVFASGNFSAEDIAINSLGEMYFTDGYDWPRSIKKISVDGIVSSFLAEDYFYPQFLAFDNSDTLYYQDGSKWPTEIKKVSPDGSISTFISGDFNPRDLCTDSSGNLYFIDQRNTPNEIKKVSPDGTITILATSESINNPAGLTIDKSKNLYFIDESNGRYVINTIRNPTAPPCPTLPPPVTQDTLICFGSSISLFASGFGELRWYDAPVGGNLLYTGSSFTTGALTNQTTYFIESFICSASTARSELKVIISPPLTTSITGITVGTDSVVLTASGGVSYLWSGGNSAKTAQNTLTMSGTYRATVTNADGCTNNVFAAVIINLPGMNKYGSVFSKNTTNLNIYGAIDALIKVDRYGKVHIQGLDGLSAGNAAASAYEIKRNFPASTDGYYWIKNPNINDGNAFKIYADMTTDGGGWTLIMCNKSPNSGWTNANAVLRNQNNPNNNGNYSIIGWADYIKKSSTGFQYMMDANTRGNYGGIWTVNQPYSFVSKSNTNTDITVNTKFGHWNYFNGGGFGPRMPWWTNQTNDGIITTSQSGQSYWWGTLVSGSGYNPSPWLSGDVGSLDMKDPGIIWYWVR